jgi:nucleoside-diphosphate-sugar epimerase
MTEVPSFAETGTKRVLLCGHRAFAARGLGPLLAAHGCEVEEFSRGPIGRVGPVISGPVDRVADNPHLASHHDTVINFVVCKGEGLDANLAYLESLMRLCERSSVVHLIHISSMSVYPDSLRVVTEGSPIRCVATERHPTYADVKTATEAYLRSRLPPRLKLSLLRPAYILGPGLPDPVGSVGCTLAGRRLLVLGRADRQRPIITRSVLHQALLRLVLRPPKEQVEVLLMVDRESPSCQAYLDECCALLGLGNAAVAWPSCFWIPVLLARDRTRRGRSFSLVRSLRSALARLRAQHYDPSWTEQRLDLPLHSDWRAELRTSDYSLSSTNPKAEAQND